MQVFYNMLKIKELRALKNLSQDDLVALTGIPKRTFVDYENGKSDIPLSKLQNIANALGVSISTILGETAYEIDDPKPTLVAEPKIVYNLPQVITVDNHNNENIVLVPVHARAGYLEGYYKPEYIRTLPTYRMPGLNNGTFRAFENKGQSMNLTFHDKSYAIGEWVEDWDRNIKDDRIYIIIHEDWSADKEGVLIKRCLNKISKYNNLICKSDNLDRRSYPNINLDPSSIKEVWEAKAGIIFNFPNPSSIFDRMNDLEAKMEEINKRIN